MATLTIADAIRGVEAGTYTVKVSLWDAAGTSISEKDVSVTVPAVPVPIDQDVPVVTVG